MPSSAARGTTLPVRRLCLLTLTLIVLGLRLWPAAEARADERELQLGVAPLFGLTYLDSRASPGGGGALHLGYGLTEGLSIQLLGGATGHPVDGGSLLAWNVGAGILYAFDIVRVVPYLEASLNLLGMTTFLADQKTELHLGLGVGLGADYVLSRRVSLGLLLRYQLSLTDPARLPVYFLAGPRVTLHFDL